MFWKRKKDKETDLPFTIEYDEDQRAYYRVKPKSDEPLFLQAEGKRYNVLDISAGGVAFQGEGFKRGDSMAGVLTMPPGQASIPVALTVLKALPEKAVAAQFKKIDDEDRERVHYYVLTRQKEELEEQRRQNKTDKPEQEAQNDDNLKD